MRAVIYCRVSSDPSNTAKSVTEQERECRAFAEREGWQIAEPVLVDNDRGASRYSRKDRPAYRQLQQTLVDGDVLVTWEASRAQRDLSAYLQLRDLCAERGVLWCYSGRVHDLSRGDDRFTTGLDALLAEKEVEQSRERVLRSVRANVAAGKPHGKPPFGYMIVRDQASGAPTDRVPDPDTAPIVREVARRVLAGDALYAIAKDFNARGIHGPRPRTDGTPSEWRPATVRQMIASPTYAGLRVHKGEIVGPGTWQPLIDVDEHERIVQLLNDPKRLRHRGTEPRWLLTGIAVCDPCGATVRRLKDSRGEFSYVCSAHACVGRRIGPVDEYVEEAVVRRLEGQDLVDTLGDADDGRAEAVRVARELRDWLDAFTDAAAEGEVSPAALAKIEAKLAPQIEAAEARVRSMARSPLVAQMIGPGARDRWARLDLVQRREILRALVEVRVLRVGAGKWRNMAVSDGLELTWL